MKHKLLNKMHETPKMELTRPCQIRAHEQTTELLETHDKCIVKMFCGTGKSRVIRAIILTQKKPLNIVVFPSLALIRQFTADYLKDKEVAKTCAIMNVSSEQLDDFQSTTEPADIRKFTVAKPKCATKMKIVCVTYQSLQVLLDSLGDAMIGLACFDEAHRTTSPEYSKLVYSDEYRAKYEKQVFFTATPANQNGITMFDRERDEMGTYGDCGPLASEYTYLQGLRDAILSLFELRVDLYTQDTLGNMYESIARAILTTGNTRVLTFHADAAEDSKSDTSVLRFVDKAKFMDAFRSVCAKEFPDKVGKFTVSNVTFTAITASTKNKDAILGAFETCTDDEIYIVSSCRTIGEGVDTKKANMCVFVDPKSSVISIIQNIGRICRKIAGSERQPATILVPVCIGWEKYVAAGDDAEKQDSLIREQLNDRENGDYNAIMNIVAALKQEDPELYELCLRYPSKFTESERKHALEEQGFRVLEDDDDACEDADLEPNVLCPEDIDELVENGDRVEIHTSNVDVPIVYRGFDDDESRDEEEEEERPIQRFYEVEEENDDGEMETRYHRIAPVNGEEDDEDLSIRLNPPKATNRPRMNIHTNDEIKLLWRMGDVVLGEQFGSGVLECQVERLDNDELWNENHQKMCEFIDENGKTPSVYKKKDPQEKRLSKWVSHQKHNYDPRGPQFSKERMKTQERWKIWTDTLADEKYSEALADPLQKWKNNYKKMCRFIEKNDKAPRMAGPFIDPEEKILGKWISGQKCNYEPRGPECSKQGMKNPEIWQIWTDTIADPKYKKHLVIDRVQDWKENCMNMCEFIDKNGKAPSAAAKDLEEKTLACWVSSQKACYNHRGAEFSKQGMKNPEIWQIWTDTIADPMYNKYLVLGVQGWMNDFANVCKFIDKNGKAPSSTAKDPEEKKIGCWISSQRAKYDSRGAKFSNTIMKNEEVWAKWTETIADPKYETHLVIDRLQDWMNDHIKLCAFIEKNHKTPSSHMVKYTAEKKIGSWMGHQKHNYDPRGSEFSKHGMKTPEIWQMWRNTLSDPKYCEYLVVDLNQNWKNDHEKMCLYIDKNSKAPSSTAKDPEEKILSNWLFAQKAKYNPLGPELSKHGMKNPELWQIWNETLADPRYNKYLVIDRVQDFMSDISNLCAFIDKNGKAPSSAAKDPEEKRLMQWLSDQKKKYHPRGPEFSKHGMKNQEMWQIWTDTLADPKYHAALNAKLGRPQSKPKATSNKSHLIPNPTAESLECSAPDSNPTSLKRVITDSPYKLTGRAWATQKSCTTHEKLQSNPAEWHAYHAARDISFQGYVDQSQIPRNRIIAQLGNKRKHRLRILDLGCGRNNIARHYADEKKFTIQGYDHVVEEGSGALVGNIADLAAQEEDESADICIYSQSLMGSDWRTYIAEGHRMLRYNGEFIISEHIKMLDDVRAELGRLGCKVESVDADASATDADTVMSDDYESDDKVNVPKWFVLVARKV
jgi:superfamily II DNA or RNA helicase